MKGKKRKNPDSIITKRIQELMGSLTQTEFAEKIHSSPPAISRIISGEEPSLNVLRDISKYCGVSVDWVLGISNKKNITGYSTFEEDRPTTYSDVIATLIRMAQNESIEIMRLEDEPQGYNPIPYMQKADFSDYIKIKDHFVGDLVISADSLLKNNPETIDSWLKKVVEDYDDPILHWDQSCEATYLAYRNYKSSLNILKSIIEEEENKK